MNLAIIDATAATPARPVSRTSPSRYATPIANTPLIRHVFDELAAVSIDRACIVAAPEVRRDLARILGTGTEWDLEVSYREAPEASRRAVLAEVGEALAVGPVLLHPGDCLCRSQIEVMRGRHEGGGVDAVLTEQATVEQLRTPSERRASDTVLVLGPATRPLVQDLLSPTSEDEDLVAALLQSDCRLSMCEEAGSWYYSDSTDALLAANRMVLDAFPSSVRNNGFDENSRLHGRIAVSPHAFVSNCVMYGPIAIDHRAVVEDAFIGPYTAIGPDTIISGAEIDNSMVLAGAEIRHPGQRIESSIVGERARITRTFGLPKGFHLRLGPDSCVELS